MTTGILVFHIFIAALMIGIILFQRNEGGALGMGGSNSMGGLMTSRGTANLLTRTTAVLATTFFVTTILLALMFKGAHKSTSILEETAPAAVETSVPTAVHTPAAETAPLANEAVPAEKAQTPEKAAPTDSVVIKKKTKSKSVKSEKTTSPQH